jgi:acyl-CoA thioesterase FadM
MSLEEFPLHLQRNAFGPRDTARAGDLWRLCQDAAVLGSSRRGWPPERYRAEGCAFVVRSMALVHHRETAFGDALVAKTWVSSFKRGTLSDRQVRVTGPHGPVVSATQRWVHVSLPHLKPGRAAPSLVEAFTVVEGDADIALPGFEAAPGGDHAWTFACWYTWMDPLSHANHPAYVDWSDEAVSRIVARQGLDPHALVPIAEEVTWRAGVVAPQTVTVTTRRVGRTKDGVVLEHAFDGSDGKRCAEATTIRGYRDGVDVLFEAVG